MTEHRHEDEDLDAQEQELAKLYAQLRQDTSRQSDVAVLGAARSAVRRPWVIPRSIAAGILIGIASTLLLHPGGQREEEWSGVTYRGAPAAPNVPDALKGRSPQEWRDYIAQVVRDGDMEEARALIDLFEREFGEQP